MSEQDRSTLVIETEHDLEPSAADTSINTVRRAYRIPLDDDERVWLMWNGKQYRVTNLSSSGLQVSYHSPAEFQEGEGLSALTIDMPGGLSIQARGTVVYTTKSDLDHFVCGIQIEYLIEKDRRHMEQLIKEWRESLFGSADE